MATALFQFQYGSIKRFGTVWILPKDTSFNSSMVRLKELAEITSCPQALSFNSSMVRLKVGTTGNYPQDIAVFQFQYGSIKSKYAYSNVNEFWAFQFQYGSIKSWYWSCNFIRSDKVSIPVWFD